jgi:hypothetical protein
MKRTVFFTGLIFLLVSCTTTRRFGTTIERDENNPCQVNIVIQVAIQGTADDVKTVRSALEACYNKQCFIPCPNDSTKGCMTKTTVVVKGYGELKEEERDAFHYVNMIDDDGLPSNAYLGTPNNGASSGTWRRNQIPGVYCHEVLHFCGLDDKYCSRLFDPVTNQITTELICTPPPDPGNGSCCTTFFNGRRCSTPCDGHEHNLMANSSAELSCQNIMDVLKLAGLDNCPEECCRSGQTFSRPPPEYYISPGYLHFGDKQTKFGGFGVSIGGVKYIGSSLGVSIDAGYHSHTDKQDNNYKQSQGLINITGGVSYRLPDPFKTNEKFSVNLHGRAGIMNWTQKTTFNNSSSKNSEQSLLLDFGGALNMKLNKDWSLRLIELRYMPTFFYEATQNNFRIGVGIVYRR